MAWQIQLEVQVILLAESIAVSIIKLDKSRLQFYPNDRKKNSRYAYDIWIII